MRSRALMAVLGSLVAAALILPAELASADPVPPVVVGTDPAGDWALDGNVIPGVGEKLGQDLLEAAIGMVDDTTVNFVITVSELPPTGGMPEFTRYIWSLDVDGKYVELDGKFTNYSRGACDPQAGSCPPPRDPGMSPFLIRGDCVTDPNTNVTTCQEKAIVKGAFDGAAGTITVPVSLELLGAVPGSVIAPGASDFTTGVGGPLVAIPTAYVSSSGFPSDAMLIGTTFTVPGAEEQPVEEPKKKKKKKKKKPKNASGELVVHKGFYL